MVPPPCFDFHHSQSCNNHRSEMNKLFERLIPDTSQLPCPSRSYIGPNGATFKTPRHLLHCPAPCDDPIKIWIGEHFFIADFCRLARFSCYFESLSNWKEGKEREITLKNPFQFSPYHIYDWAFTGSFISYFFSGLMLDGVMWDFYQILCKNHPYEFVLLTTYFGMSRIIKSVDFSLVYLGYSKDQTLFHLLVLYKALGLDRAVSQVNNEISQRIFSNVSSFDYTPFLEFSLQELVDFFNQPNVLYPYGRFLIKLFDGWFEKHQIVEIGGEMTSKIEGLFRHTTRCYCCFGKPFDRRSPVEVPLHHHITREIWQVGTIFNKLSLL